MTTTIPDINGTNVISLEVIRKNRQHRKMLAECTHGRISVDTMLSHLKCLDCGALLNPIEWVASLAEEWDRIKRVTKQYTEAVEKYEKRSRTKCMHCGEMTKISY